MKLKKSCHFQKNQLSTSHPCSISFNQRFLSDRVHTFHFYFCGKVYPQGVWWSDDVMLVSQLHQKCITVGPWISRCLCPSSHRLALSEISEVMCLHASLVLASLTIFKKSIPNRYLQKQREEWRNRVEEHKWHAYHSSTQKLCYLNLYHKIMLASSRAW